MRDWLPKHQPQTEVKLPSFSKTDDAQHTLLRCHAAYIRSDVLQIVHN